MSKQNIILSREQVAALKAKGNVLIAAGPGSGKTRTLTAIVSDWLQNGANPDEVIALTFTNKAADEMRGRVKSICSLNDKELPFIGTFHSYAARYIRTTRPNMIIWDEYDSRAAWKSICEKPEEEELYWDYEYAGNFHPSVQLLIANSRMHNRWWDCYDELVRDYKQIMADTKAFDFQMLIQTFVEEQHLHSRKYDYIAVDEYQDTSSIQYEMIKALSHQLSKVVAVGDQDQMLYHWRGASLDNIRLFIENFKADTILLEDNYRSGPSICFACNNVIIRNRDRIAKDTRAIQKHDSIVSVKRYGNESKQAKVIAAEIAYAGLQAGNDTAILIRSGSVCTPVLEEELRKRDVPYRIIGARSFFNRKEIRVIIGLLKYIVNANYVTGLLSFSSFYGLGLTQKRLKILTEYTENKATDLLCGSFDDLKWAWVSQVQKLLDNVAHLRCTNLKEGLAYLFETLGLWDKLSAMDKKNGTARQEAVMRFISQTLESYQNASDALLFLSLASEQDEDMSDISVKIMTIHAAKGLEFDNVYIIGLEENCFPNRRSLEEEDGEEAERRVFFVACSRAKHRLSLSWCKEKLSSWPRGRQQPSRFLDEIKENS